MIHIILTILKIIGILILIILGLMLFLLLAGLFLPVEYRAKIKKNTQVLEGKLNISWFFWLIWVQIGYQDGKANYNIRILGIPVEHLRKVKELIGKFIGIFSSLVKKVIPGRQSKKPADDSAPKEEADQDHIQKAAASEPETEPVPRPEAEAPAQALKESVFQRIKQIIRKILGIPAAIRAFFKKIYLTFRTFYGRIKHWKRFLTGESMREAQRFVFGKGSSLFRHIRPKKVKGSIKFGFEDPSLTGQLLAGISLFYPVYKKGLSIIPVFDDQILEVDLYLKGRISGWVILKTAWQIYRNKHVKTTIRDFQHKEA